MTLPPDYFERVYAGVLGKLIGVYLGRPFEGWWYDTIMAKMGEINYYVHERLNKPLVVTDDDITGTFTFLRALEDYGPAVTPAEIGATWLNYIVEKQSILWWGGLGNSTEHTAYLRLKRGILPPHSGSIALNGKTMAEQIGAQIFIDGWGMVAPGDPQLAADLARRAASVSHDGEAIYGAQVIAAIEALAFVEPDLNRLLDAAVSLIPHDSTIYRLIADVRNWHAARPDWRSAREKIAANYGYDKFGGNCHIVPNHALIHLALLYSGDNFQKAQMIVNTSGWDTDCNAANVGCVMGIKNGLAGIDAGPDWRGPLADRMYLPTADGARCISDAVQESVRITNFGRQLRGLTPLAPKNGARFHFEAPGAVQGFESQSAHLRLENAPGRGLALRYHHLAPGTPVCAVTPTFIRPDDLNMDGYPLHASPTLYPGQTVCARVTADADNPAPLRVGLHLNVYGADDLSQAVSGPALSLAPGETRELRWKIGDDYDHQPIHAVGLQLSADVGTAGSVYLDHLTWDGTPDVIFTRPSVPGSTWQRAWVCGVDRFGENWTESFRPVQNEGRGLLIQGAREWQNYRVEADLKPLLFAAGGLAVCVQGLRRYYALLLAPGGKIQLVKMFNTEQILAETDFDWAFDQTYQLALETRAGHLRASLNGQMLFDITDPSAPFTGGAIALVLEEGCFGTRAVSVRPLTP